MRKLSIIDRIDFKKLSLSALATGCFCLTFLFFGPLDMYIRNIRSLWFSLETVLITAVVSTLIVLLVFTIALYLIPEKISKYLTAIVFGIGVGALIQAYFLQINYGILDGTEVQWNDYIVYGVINSIVWIVCISTPIVLVKIKPTITKTTIKFIAMFVIIAQVIMLVISLIALPKQPIRPIITIKDMLSLSSSENVVVFMIDTFDAELMDELLDTYPEYTDIFVDFTYYRNTLAAYQFTKPSVPYFLSGIPYLNHMPFDDYLNDVFSEAPLFDVLHDNNYSSGIYGFQYFANESLLNNSTNTINQDYIVSSYPTFSMFLYQFTAIRYAPHVLKQYVWTYHDIFDQLMTTPKGQYQPYIVDDITFYKKLKEEHIQINDGEKAFRFYHMYGSHQPFKYDESVTPLGTRDVGNITSQTRGTLEIIHEYINQLKENDIYDNTMIIITSDHGWFSIRQNIPLIVKNWDERKEFSISNAPIAFGDIIPTVCNAITGSKDFGQDFCDLDEEKNRNRVFYIYEWDDSWRSQSLPDTFECIWTGEVLDLSTAAWTGTIFPRELIEIREQRNYQLGEVVTFRLWGGEGMQYVVNKNLEGGFRAFGTSSELSMTLDEKPIDALSLELRFFVFTGLNERKRLTVYVNEQVLTEKEYTSLDTSDRFIIPAGMVDSTDLNIRFELHSNVYTIGLDYRNIEDFVSFVPVSFNIDYLKGITITDKNPILEIDFLEYGNSDKFLLDGWHSQEQTGVWTSELSSLNFYTSESVDLQLTVSGRIFTPSELTLLLINGHQLYQFDPGHPASVEITVPANYLSPNGWQRLEFVSPNAIEPYKTGLNDDTRRLGIHIRNITISALSR